MSNPEKKEDRIVDTCHIEYAVRRDAVCTYSEGTETLGVKGPLLFWETEGLRIEVRPIQPHSSGAPMLWWVREFRDVEVARRTVRDEVVASHIVARLLRPYLREIK